MTFDYMLDLYFRTAKDFIGAGALSLLHTSLFKFWEVPYSNCLVKRSWS